MSPTAALRLRPFRFFVCLPSLHFEVNAVAPTSPAWRVRLGGFPHVPDSPRACQLVAEAAAAPPGGSAPSVQGRLEVGERGAGRPLSPASSCPCNDRDDRPAPVPGGWGAGPPQEGRLPGPPLFQPVRLTQASSESPLTHPGVTAARGHPSLLPSFPGPDTTSVCRHRPRTRRGHGSHQQGSSVTELQGFSADSPSGAALSL